MTINDFILSDQRRHKLSRHIVFWVVWSLAYNLFYQFPIHEFKGYGEWGPMAALEVQKMGAFVYFFKVLLINSFLGAIVPQIALVYVMLYWILPRFFYVKRSLVTTFSVMLGVLMVFFLVAAFFKMSYPIYVRISGTPSNIQPTIWLTFSRVTSSMFVNQLTSLPIILGLALAIKLIKRWWLKEKEAELLAKEIKNAELQLLKAQIHPHFLFNTLNNIYFFTLSGSPKAPEMINRLSGMLNYILNECNQSIVSLEKESKMIQDYMSLEKIRYGEEINISVELPENSSNKMIAPLLLIPFVENSFKHGASKMLSHPFVKLRISIEDDILHFFIINNRPPESPELPVNNQPAEKMGNIGLKNVKKRLQLLYPRTHELNIISEPGNYVVYLKIDLQEKTQTEVGKEEIISKSAYAMA